MLNLIFFNIFYFKSRKSRKLNGILMPVGKIWAEPNSSIFGSWRRGRLEKKYFAVVVFFSTIAIVQVLSVLYISWVVISQSGSVQQF